jgi:hypothetical protein
MITMTPVSIASLKPKAERYEVSDVLPGLRVQTEKRGHMNSVSIIPAQPGWDVAIFASASPGPNGWEDHFMLWPIIAWEVERHEGDRHTWDEPNVNHTLTPLTAEGNLHPLSNVWALKPPDGRYIFVGDGIIHANEADALEEARKQTESWKRLSDGCEGAPTK